MLKQNIYIFNPRPSNVYTNWRERRDRTIRKSATFAGVSPAHSHSAGSKPYLKMKMKRMSSEKKMATLSIVFSITSS